MLNYWPFSLLMKLVFFHTWFPFITLRVCVCVSPPDCLSPPNVPHVRRQVSLVRAAGLHGGESLRRGSLLPQGVFPLFDLRLHAASVGTRLRFQTRYVPPSAFRKWFQCSALAAASSGGARIVSSWYLEWDVHWLEADEMTTSLLFLFFTTVCVCV